MESEALTIGHRSDVLQRVLASAVPVVWIAISYVDPGKWAATVEGGARFGFDVVLLMLIFNCVAILCQCLSARIAVITGKDLAQICSEEYDSMTCVFLGVQAEISIIALDLMMVLGTAYGLNAIFGIDLFNCVFLTGIDAIIFPFLATLLENRKAKLLSICLTSIIFLFYVFGVLTTPLESSFSMGGMLAKLSGESAYALMSLLGASITPHNFYIHSSIVQQDQGRTSVSKGSLCHDHFVATVCIFSGIFLVNCLLINLAANEFYSSTAMGLRVLTFQDALSLLDQVEVFRSSITSVALILILFFSNQIIALTWSRGRQVIINDFFGMDIPGWLHRATIRIIAIIPALYCVWSSGAEGIYQLLIFTQVMVALLLPSSVIPLFRVASSRSIMGGYKMSQLVELFALVSFIGMLVLKIIFVIEMIFGNSDWVTNLKWSIVGSVPISYLILLATASIFLCFMLWLAITPLKSASSSGLDAQVPNWEAKFSAPEPSSDRDQIEISDTQYQIDRTAEKQVSALSLDKSYGSQKSISTPRDGLKSTDMQLNSDSDLHSTTIEKNKSEITLSGPSVCSPEASGTIGETAMAKLKVPEDEPVEGISFEAESKDMVEKTLRIEGSIKNDRDDEGEQLEPEESTKDVSESIQSSTSDGPGSFRSLKGDDPGSGPGSLSRLAGLGRAARRQLAVILEEFWGQLFDYHGQATQEAKAKKLDVLLGIDLKVDAKSSFASVKAETINSESSLYSPTMGGRGSDSRTSSVYSSPQQQIGRSAMESALGVQQGSSMWSTQMQLFDAYVQGSSHDSADPGERRYYSMRVPTTSAGYDHQPKTIHGYQLAYLSQMSKEKDSDYLNAQLESLNQKSSPLIKSNYADSFARPSKQKPQSGLSTQRPPGFHNTPVSRNSSLKSDRAFHDLSSPEPAEYSNSSVNVKKYCSLPDISGLRIPQQDYSLSGNISQWKNQMGYGQSISRLAPVQTGASWAGTASGYGELSPSNVCRDALSLQFASSSGAGSLWSKQPYEQFGVADKSPSKTQEPATTMMDLEARLLQSFRSCILKLLKLEGSDWLFRQNDGADEDLIDRVALREQVLYEVETRGLDRKLGSGVKIDESEYMKLLSIPHCGDGCVWKVDIVVSFGVWCIHRILYLSLMESRPELWGKYTYVLNRLQGIIDLAFAKPRSPMAPCFCLQLPMDYQQRSSPPISNGSLPPPPKPGRGKFTTAASLLDVIKDVEIAISCRKGRTGTAAGDVAFPKGKENLASVLKRYKRRLSNKPVGPQEVGPPGLHKVQPSLSQGL